MSQEDPLEKEMRSHSSILAWGIPWTEEPSRIQSMGSQESDRTDCAQHTHIDDMANEKSLFQDLGMEGEKIQNKRILKKDLSKKKKKKTWQDKMPENFFVIRLRLVLGFGNTESLVTFAGMISVKPDCLKWLDTRTMGLVFFFFFPQNNLG